MLVKHLSEIILEKPAGYFVVSNIFAPVLLDNLSWHCKTTKSCRYILTVIYRFGRVLCLIKSDLSHRVGQGSVITQIIALASCAISHPLMKVPLNLSVFYLNIQDKQINLMKKEKQISKNCLTNPSTSFGKLYWKIFGCRLDFASNVILSSVS